MKLVNVLNKFSNDKLQNEIIVTRFTSKHFGFVLRRGKCKCINYEGGECIQSCLAPIVNWK